MTIFKHHDHDPSVGGDAVKATDEAGQNAAEQEQFEGTEDPLEREYDRSVRNEVRNTTFLRPPGI